MLRQAQSREDSLSSVDKEEKRKEDIEMTSHWILIITCFFISGMTVSGFLSSQF